MQETALEVFVVHGHDHGVKEAVARFLERLGLAATVLHEKPDQGRTIIEKFENYAKVRYAVKSSPPMTWDTPNIPDESKPRPRQNVVLAAWLFLGARFLPERVAALYSGGVELPSDLAGVLYVPFDAEGAWKLRLAKEPKAAGLPVNMNDAV